MIWIALSLLVIGLAFVVLLMLGSNEQEGKVDPRVVVDKKQDAVPSFIKDYLAQHSVELPPQVIYLVMAVAGGGVLISLLVLPFKIALIVSAAIPGVLYLGMKSLGNRRKQMMLEQLPSFINQVTRRLSAGISVENAFSDSVETLERPLGTVMRRVVRRVHMGEELHRAFDREANHNRLKEFNVLATAIRINEQYGGSIRSILDDIVAILRLDEAGKRELNAMTGETRFTAVVLALIPPATVAYMMYMMPDMVMTMWNDPGGQNALLAATFMELFGVVALWRMIKSVGT